jgi:hypothetical protein
VSVCAVVRVCANACADALFVVRVRVRVRVRIHSGALPNAQHVKSSRSLMQAQECPIYSIEITQRQNICMCMFVRVVGG